MALATVPEKTPANAQGLIHSDAVNERSVRTRLMKLLITGICGFVGSTLAAELLSATPMLEIIGIDNLSRSGSWRNRDALQASGITVFHGDIRQSSDVDALPPVDWVIDAAANASVLAGITGASSRQLVENNLQGTINLLEYCKRHRSGFVLLSTSRVYSILPLASLKTEVHGRAFIPTDNHMPPGLSAQGIQEHFPTTAPVSLYGGTKLASEQLALEYGHAFAFSVWINRCGVMAGAGQFGKPDQGIFAFWLHSWREQRSLKYIGFGGHGYQVRDCLHPCDLASLVLKQLACSNDGRSQIVNVSGGRASARSLAQLSQWCESRWGSLPVAADASERPYDLPWVVLDHALASKLWEWQPQVTTETILTEIAEFADANPDWIALSR